MKDLIALNWEALQNLLDHPSSVKKQSLVTLMVNQVMSLITLKVKQKKFQFLGIGKLDKISLNHENCQTERDLKAEKFVDYLW